MRTQYIAMSLAVVLQVPDDREASQVQRNEQAGGGGTLLAWVGLPSLLVLAVVLGGSTSG